MVPRHELQPRTSPQTTSSSLDQLDLLVRSVSYVVADTNALVGTGFDADEGASLLMAFRGLQAESKKQGEAHHALAKELETMVASPFEQWAQSHRVRYM